MVYGTAERHSANLEIESAIGKGTIVRLSFPMPVTTTIAESGTHVTHSALTSQSILVIDDDPIVLKFGKTGTRK
jgi:hypothetical protein